MRVGVIGRGRQAEQRSRAVQGLRGITLVDPWEANPEEEPADLYPFLEGLDVVFVTVPAAEHFQVAEVATKRGVHVFLEWPPATSTRECASIVHLAEEAGVEVGLSRPLRFHPVFSALPEGWRPDLVLVHQEVAPGGAWQRHLADAVDLCCAFAGSSSVQRIDAEAARSGPAWPDALAFGIRFHNGVYVQGSLRRTDGAPSGELYAAGPGLQVAADLAGTEVRRRRTDGGENAVRPTAFAEGDPGAADPLRAETAAFLEAAAEGRPVPVSVLDGLHTMRLLEKMMRKLR